MAIAEGGVGELEADGAAKRGRDERPSGQRSWPPTFGEDVGEKRGVAAGEEELIGRERN